MTALIAYLKYNFLYNKLRKISAVGAQNYAYGHFIIKHYYLTVRQCLGEQCKTSGHSK